MKNKDVDFSQGWLEDVFVETKHWLEIRMYTITLSNLSESQIVELWHRLNIPNSTVKSYIEKFGFNYDIEQHDMDSLGLWNQYDKQFEKIMSNFSSDPYEFL